MSEQRTYIGKLWELNLENKTPEEYAEQYMRNIGKTELPTYYDNWVKYFLHYNDYKFIRLNGKLYNLSIENESDESDFCVIHKESDGSFSFATSFYDGGTYLEEVLTDEFERMQNQKIMLGTCIAIVATLIALLATYVLSIRHIKPIIRNISFNIWYFARTYDKLTTEAIRNITWNDHDRLMWLVTLVWVLSMFCGAIFALIMFMNFG